jgi:hypothetical protein
MIQEQARRCQRFAMVFIALCFRLCYPAPIIGGVIMSRKVKKAFYAMALLILLVGCFACATTTSVGVGYNVPMTPHDRAGYGFGIGF